MNRILSLLFIALVSFMCNSSFAAAPTTGSFFNITTVGPSLIITTNTGNKTYTAAGIKINTVGYIFPVPGQCTKTPSGFCLFQVSNTTPAIITIVGAVMTPLEVTLCLNGVGQLSCQLFTPFETN